MQSDPPRRRRPRPVADAPVDALLGRVDEIAKGWLLALLERAPLEEMPTLLADGAAREGPRICDAVIRALAADDDLRRLEPGGPAEMLVSRAGELAGARDAAETAAAVDALHDVIWTALRAALVDPDADQVAELAQRLAMVTGVVRGAALRRPAAPGPAARAGGSWVPAFEQELSRAERTGAQLSLLLAELEDANRVTAVEGPAAASAVFGRFAEALSEAVGRQDVLACESEARAWVVARNTGRAAAEELAGRIATAVRRTGDWRGAPIRVTVGIAVLGEDGHDSAALVAAAEEARFLAAASGVVVAPAGPPPDGEV